MQNRTEELKLCKLVILELERALAHMKEVARTCPFDVWYKHQEMKTTEELKFWRNKASAIERMAKPPFVIVAR